jgi:hypothetical protein
VLLSSGRAGPAGSSECTWRVIVEGAPGDDRRDHRLGHILEVGAQTTERPRRHRPGRRPAGPGVVGRIGLQQEARRPPRRLLAEVADADAGRRAERLVVAHRRVDLGEACHRPDSLRLEEDDGAGLSQLLVMRVTIAQEVLGEGVEVENRSFTHRGPHG